MVINYHASGRSYLVIAKDVSQIQNRHKDCLPVLLTN